MRGNNPSHPAMESGERCELPSGVHGRALIAQRFSAIFSLHDGLCPDSIILLIVDYYAAIGATPQSPPPPLCAADDL